MSTLRSVLDEMRMEDPSRMSETELEEGLLERERAANVLLADRARWLAEVERRQTFRKDGFLTPEAWLSARTNLSYSDAKRQVRTARALDRMPATREALAGGEVSSSTVRVLVHAQETNPEEFPEAEAMLLDAARTSSPKELASTVTSWRIAADEGSGEREERMFRRRAMTVLPTLEGMVRMDGNLDPESGQTVITAIRAYIDAEVRASRDTRSPMQRRADAITGICRWWLDSSDRPTVAGERPHLTVVVDAEALETGIGRCEFEDTGPTSPETAARIACDSTITRLVMKGRSMPIDVGRATPVIPGPMRKALVARDNGCRFPGCGLPAPWCDGHHIVHLAHGGVTALSNLVLLCRRHHRLIHQRAFSVRMIGEQPVFFRADGTQLQERRPP
ncbi:MAG: DUF222 domain-containing protein [Actinomycetota bacterium]